ncbi:MAG: hypothetical protein QE285_12930 [Aquabacterium sp.]|nr:hypothetical protein [Aquabacterium sp.]
MVRNATGGHAARHPGLTQGPLPRRTPMRESCVPDTARRTPMDIEQVNAIGTLLADLSARTEQLRGYL